MQPAARQGRAQTQPKPAASCLLAVVRQAASQQQGAQVDKRRLAVRLLQHGQFALLRLLEELMALQAQLQAESWLLAACCDR